MSENQANIVKQLVKSFLSNADPGTQQVVHLVRTNDPKALEVFKERYNDEEHLNALKFAGATLMNAIDIFGKDAMKEVISDVMKEVVQLKTKGGATRRKRKASKRMIIKGGDFDALDISLGIQLFIPFVLLVCLIFMQMESVHMNNLERQSHVSEMISRARSRNAEQSVDRSLFGLIVNEDLSCHLCHKNTTVSDEPYIVNAVLNCNHTFHFDCIESHDTCPVCRSVINQIFKLDAFTNQLLRIANDATETLE